MWIAAHGRLLTNARRSKWGVGVSPICSICGNDEETVIHTLRDCMEWIFMNLNKRDIGSQEGSWQSIFMVACWHLWNWRNKAIFEEDFQRPNDPSQVILRMTKDIEQYERTL
ncbi:ribonuclease H, partial [Trifolium pratense]